MANLQPNDDVGHPIELLNKESKKKKYILLKRMELPIIISLVIFSFLTGVIGYSKYIAIHEINKNFSTVLIDTIKLFQFSGGPDLSPIPWQLEISRWLSPTIFIYAAIKGLAIIFREQVEILKIRHYRNHAIVIGLGDKGSMLAQYYKSKGYDVVVIDQDEENPNIKFCRQQGMIPLIGKANDYLTLLKAGIDRAKIICVVCGNNNMNAEVSKLIPENLSLKKTTKTIIKIHLDNPHYWHYIRSRIFLYQTQSNYIIDFFNIYDLSARQLINEFPLLNKQNDNLNKSNMTIVGFGKLAEQLIINAGREWCLHEKNKNVKIALSVVDVKANRKVNLLISKYKRLEEIYEFSLYDISINDPSFYQNELWRSKSQSPIFLCFDEDETNIICGLYLQNIIKEEKRKIVVPILSEYSISSLVSNEKSDTDQLVINNLFNKIINSNMIDKGNYEEIARTIHNDYLKNEQKRSDRNSKSSRALVEWELLPEDLKESNREQAISIHKKLLLIGCEIIPWYYPTKKTFRFSKDEIELLAKTEHERWCKHMIEQGWEYGERRDEEQRKHPSIIEWESPQLSEDEKEKDRNTVRLIPKYLRLSGFQITRCD